MKRSAVAFLLGLRALAAPGVAAADDATAQYVAKFRALCVATNANPVSATAVADANGWKPWSSSPDFGGAKVVREWQDGSVTWHLLLGQKAFPDELKPVPVDLCLVERSGPTIGLNDQIQTWLGFPPSKQTSVVTVFGFSEHESGRTPLAAGPASESVKAMRDGSFRAVTISADASHAMLGYMAALPPK